MSALPDPVGDVASRADIDRLSRDIAELRAAIEQHEKSLKLGLTRMGQLQAEIDLMRGARAKVKATA